MRNARMRYWWLGSVLLVVLLISGCPKKTPPPSETGLGPGGTGPSDMGERDLTAPGAGTQDNIDRGPQIGGPLRDVHFDYDSFELTAEARETLRTNADWVKSSVQSKIEVEGHCDDRGTAEYNLALGAKRAKSARDYMVSLGISPDRLSTISYGEELPLCREETESCWQENRRVHSLVLNR